MFELNFISMHKRNSKSGILYLLVLIISLNACKKTGDVICFSCNAPLIRYSYVYGADTVDYDFSMLSRFDTMQNPYYLNRGYVLTVDTLWATPISFNQCYDRVDYTGNVYPMFGHFFNDFCKQQ